MNAKAAAKLQSKSTEELVELFETTTGSKDENIDVVRGWIMDVLETRDYAAFDAWLGACDDSPRQFFLAVNCSCHGCKNDAAFETQQLVGKKQYLQWCERCAPVWVKALMPAIWFRARKIGGEWVSGASEHNPN